MKNSLVFWGAVLFERFLAVYPEPAPVRLLRPRGLFHWAGVVALALLPMLVALLAATR